MASKGNADQRTDDDGHSMVSVSASDEGGEGEELCAMAMCMSTSCVVINSYQPDHARDRDVLQLCSQEGVLPLQAKAQSWRVAAASMAST